MYKCLVIEMKDPDRIW